jgi:Ca2+-binding RTX toxin-like protein
VSATTTASPIRQLPRRLALALAATLLVLAAGAATASVAWATPVIVNGSSADNWLESDAAVGSGAGGTDSRRIYYSFVVKRNASQPITNVQVDADYDGTSFNNAATATVRTIQVLSNGYVWDRVSGHHVVPDTGGFSCGLSSTRRHTRPVRFRVVNAAGTSSVVSRDIRFVIASDCLGREDFAYLYERSQSATEVAPGTTVTFNYKGDDYDSENFHGLRYRLRNMETGAVSAVTARCDSNQYGTDNEARSIDVAMPTARGRYVVEAELASGGCANGDYQDAGRWWRLGAVDVNRTAAVSPTASLSGIPARAGGPNAASFTATVTASDTDTANVVGTGQQAGQIHAVEWDADNVSGYEVFNFNNGTWPSLGVTTAHRQQTVNAASFSHGTTVTVRARVTDNGALSASDDIARSVVASQSFVVDKVAPAPTVAAPAGAWLAATETTLSGVAGNTAGDSNTVTVRVYEGAAVAGSPIQQSGRTRSGATWSWPVSGLADGQTYTVQATQTDDAGNTGTSDPVTFTVDATLPDVAITSGPDSFSKQSDRDATYEYTATDDNLTAVECRVDGGAWEPCADETALTGLSDGLHTFEVRAKDAAGNEGHDFRTVLVGPSSMPGCTITSGDETAVTGTAGDDVICLGPDGHSVNAGAGADTVHGGAGNDTIDGGTGPDTLYGGPGNDVLHGGSADAATDRLDGGPGSDTMTGGPGIDRVLYDRHGAGVTVSLDGVANDGASGENDNVGTDVESITGSERTDTLTGNGSSNTFSGRGGDDTINGLGADDFMGGSLTGNHTFNGGEGTDRVTYTHYPASSPVTVTLDGEANDGAAGETDNVQPDIEYVYGTPGDDHISAPEDHETGISFWGYGGNDVLLGGAGNDHLWGMEGDDELRGRGGHDILVGDVGDDELRGGAGDDENRCGDGTDAFEVDPDDTFDPILEGNCEVPIVLP